MSYDLEPVVGHWYRVVDKGDLFRVVGVDGDNDTIEVRWFDGDGEELDSGSWFEMDLEEAEAPEGWTDPGDDDDEDEDDEKSSDWDDDDGDDDDDDEDDDEEEDEGWDDR